MSSTDLHPAAYGPRDRYQPGIFARAEMWLDERGKWAWIAAMVGGFIIFWPIGLALLAYMIWSKRMFSNTRQTESVGNWSRRCGNGREMNRERFNAARAAMRPSGNHAFDAYKSETLQRLEAEQTAFEDFLARLREAKDKAEFDQFMADRARRTQDNDVMPEPSGN